MAEFDTQLAEAIERLKANTPGARGAVYASARSALAEQLRTSNPPLAPAEVTARRRELEEAIQRTERVLRASSGATPAKESGAAGRMGPRVLLAILVLLVVGGAAYAAYAYWDDLGSLFGASDEVGEVVEPEIAAVDPAVPVAEVVPAYAIFYMGQEDGGVPAYNGTIAWTFVDDPVAPRLDIHVEIPDRGVTFDLAMREAPETLPAASHTIDVVTAAPADFAAGALQSLVQLAGKSTEDGIGNAVVATFVSVEPGHAVVELAAASEGRNLSQMRQEWFDLGLVFADGEQAILSFSKGSAGNAAMREAMAAWD